MSKRVLKNILKNGNEYEVGNIKLYVITEDIVSVSTDSTKGVSPYNTSYGYTNITIDENSGTKWKEGAVYAFVINTEMVVASAYRNIRVRIGTSGDWKPVMNASNTIMAGSSYFTKARNDLYVYKTTNQSGGALHMNNDTSYSAMSVAEGQTGTATSARTVRADYLKQIIEYHARNLDSQLNIPSKTSDLTNDSGFITSSYHDSSKQDTLTAGEGITIDENNVISAEGGGGGVDVETINVLIDLKLGNYDTLFKIEDGLYKILNDLDSEDNLGLESGDTRADIVGNATNMSKVSHSRAVMTKVVNSPYAFGLVVNSSNGMKEVSECWNSMAIIANDIDSAISYLTSPYIDTYINTAIVQDAFNWENLIPYMPDSLFTSMYLEDSTKVAEIPTNSELKDRLNKMTPDALLPAIFYRTNLSGYSSFESLCQNNSAMFTLMNNTNAMIIVNNNNEAKAIYDNYAIYDISVVANNPSILASCLKNSDWITYFTSSEHNAELQSQVVNMYNTVVNNSSYFTQSTRTYADSVSQLNSSTKVSNAIVFTACGYWSNSSSQKTNVFHANSVQAHSGSENYRPTSVSASNVNCVSFTNCTFTETSDGYAAIAVYTAN